MTVDRVAESLKALGVEKDVMEDPRERVYEVLVDLWKEKKGPPEIREISRVIGLAPSSIGHHLSQLAVDGRVAKLRKGVWLPLVG